MLSLSKSTGYAVLALACLDDPGGEPIRALEVAERTGIPKSYLPKITRPLAAKGLVTTKRGYRGGLILNRPAREISLKEVVEAMEGPGWMGECLLGIGKCVEDCPTLPFWEKEKKRIVAELGRRNLGEITSLRKAQPPPQAP